METSIMSDLCGLEAQLCSMLKASLTDVKHLKVEDLTATADAIKDIAEAKEKCYKSKYYHSIVDAMKKEEERGEEYERMGYNHNRYPSSGRYASAGHGERYGYPMGYDGSMGYDGGGNMGYQGESPVRNANDRMGYRGSRYGMNYERYRDARRHYTETHDQADTQKMNQAAKEHMDSVSESLRDMWNDANQQTRDQIKETLNRLAQELN